MTNKLFYGDNLDVLRESIADQSLDHACEAGGYDAAESALKRLAPKLGTC